MPTGRIVAFRIYEGDEIIVEGKFFVTAEEGVSCFGEYRAAVVSGELAAPIFEGVVIRHAMEADGATSIKLDLYAVDTSGKAPRQCRVLPSGTQHGL